jgi:putative transposase
MLFRMVMFVWEFALDLLAVLRLAADAKDIEILLLRQQLRIATRQQERGPHIPRWQKVPLAILAMRLKDKARNASEVLAASVRLFKPDTLITWHQAIVKRKWTFNAKRKPGRPRIAKELENLILRLARDNPSLGYDKLEGEFRKLVIKVSATTIRTVLKRHGILPAPDRVQQSSSWLTFLNHYKEQFLACDFFTVETVRLQTLYVLFFIEHHTRRVYITGCTAHPNNIWVTQQARQMSWELQTHESAIRFLIHDHDTKFTQSFDTGFEADAIEIVDIPYHAPSANAFAERWVRSVRQECLDHLIILNQQHLRNVLTEYTAYYNQRRPHQSLAQDSPLGLESASNQGTIRHRKVLGGIIRDYYREVA